MKKLLCILMLTSLTSMAASALYCSGAIDYTYIDSAANVYVKGAWLNNYTRLCNLKGTVNNIDAITCSMWGSMVTTALKDKKKVTIKYLNASAFTCATLPTYNNTPKVLYVMLRKEDVL